MASVKSIKKGNLKLKYWLWTELFVKLMSVSRKELSIIDDF